MPEIVMRNMQEKWRAKREIRESSGGGESDPPTVLVKLQSGNKREFFHSILKPNRFFPCHHSPKYYIIIIIISLTLTASLVQLQAQPGVGLDSRAKLLSFPLTNLISPRLTHIVHQTSILSVSLDKRRKYDKLSNLEPHLALSHLRLCVPDFSHYLPQLPKLPLRKTWQFLSPLHLLLLLLLFLDK